MRDRLIELLKGAENKVSEMLTRPLELEEWLGIYADYLLANGVIVPPCKVGDTVYRVIEMGTGIHFKQVGRCGIGHSQGYKIVPCEEKIKRFIRTVEVSKNNFFDICENFGKTVFLTREEAEAKLKGEQ